MQEAEGSQNGAPELLPPSPHEDHGTEALVEKIGRVLAIHGEKSLVDVNGTLCRCSLSGRLKHRRKDAQPVARAAGGWQRDSREIRGRWERSRDQAPPSSPIAVGDRVILRADDSGAGMILERLERQSWLGRMRPTKGPQVIAANVDIALVVIAVAMPEPDFFLLDQFLVQAAAGDLEPWIVFNKIDLLEDSEPSVISAPDEYSEAAFYRAIGYPVFCTSAFSGSGIVELQARLEGRTAVLAGPSGVGKSHLLNHLAPKADARLGEISEWSGRGQHTTTHVAMYPLQGGGYLVDAPGIRRLSLWQVDSNNLVSYFPEFQNFASTCDFRGCSHLQESDCAVRAAAERGDLPWRRYRHYQQMRGGQR